MAVLTTNEENRFQQGQPNQLDRAEEIARNRRQVAEESGYVYRRNRG